MKKGQIFLIPCSLGEHAPMSVLPLTVLKVIEATNHYVVEHEKNARRFIKSIYPQKNQALPRWANTASRFQGQSHNWP